MQLLRKEICLSLINLLENKPVRSNVLRVINYVVLPLRVIRDANHVSLYSALKEHQVVLTFVHYRACVIHFVKVLPHADLYFRSEVYPRATVCAKLPSVVTDIFDRLKCLGGADSEGALHYGVDSVGNIPAQSVEANSPLLATCIRCEPRFVSVIVSCLHI